MRTRLSDYSRDVRHKLNLSNKMGFVHGEGKICGLQVHT